jgi:DNA-directed RNA polymerase beta subunit
MASLDFSKQVKYAVDNNLHGNKEAALGRALLEPFSSTNSGSRKLMFAKELDQVFPLINGEVAAVSTGYEIRYGDLSSSIKETDDDYVLLAKIPKYSFAPDHHYFALMGKASKKELTIIERVSFTHITEAYGYLNNNSVLDSINVGDYVPRGTKLKKSVAFDEYGNRKDGINLNTIYMSLDHNYEDSIIIYEDAAKKYVSPLFHTFQMVIPENFIPLNMHGNSQIYKVMPDIGEAVPECIVAAFRPEIKDESYYTQQKQMLCKLMMSDEKYIVHGEDLRVVDVNIYSNNTDLLKSSPYYAQFNMYYQEQLRFAKQVEDTVGQYIAQGYSMAYELQKLFYDSKRVLRGDKYVDKKLYSNMIVDITVLEERPLGIGDKLADRNGGKGVVSNIWPAEKMPMLADGTVVDAVINSPTMYGRENPAQCFEVSITHVARELINYIEDNNIPLNEAIELILKYVDHVVPEEGEVLRRFIEGLSVEDAAYYLQSVIQDRYINIASKPISDSYDIDRLNELYKAFPFIGQVDIYVPMKDSNGNLRRVKARRKTVMGKRYTLRLKQFSEEKFSAVSLSSTNLRNENVKSKAATNYKSAHSSTCNRLGYQEAGCLSHAGPDYTVSNLMIHSASPHARRLTEAMLTGDPYDVDIKMTNESRNRTAEFAETYLKTIGLRLNFIKKLKKKIQTMAFNCVKFFKGKPEDRGMKECVRFIDEPGYDFWAAYQRREELAEKNKDKEMIYPVRFKLRKEDK